jgi:hypothetical protein
MNAQELNIPFDSMICQPYQPLFSFSRNHIHSPSRSSENLSQHQFLPSMF